MMSWTCNFIYPFQPHIEKVKGSCEEQLPKNISVVCQPSVGCCRPTVASHSCFRVAWWERKETARSLIALENTAELVDYLIRSPW